MVTRALPARDAAVRLLRERFLNRTDLVAIQAPWGKPCPVDANGTLDELLLGHLLGAEVPEAKVRYVNRRGSGAMKGRFRVGSYCPSLDDTTRWLCLDFDGPGHAHSLADSQATAGNAFDTFTEAGLPVYLEQSGGGKGWHLWCFFDPPIPAAKAQELGHALAPKDAPLADGKMANASSNRGIEVFPKQKSRRSGFGNLVWLPWWQGAPEGANAFYRHGEGGVLEPFVPTEFATTSSEEVDRVLATVVRPPSPPRPTREHRETKAAPPPVAESPPGTADLVWVEWRRRALAALPIESVYGTWLTGKAAGAGWLECRDPSSPSGDQHPSASVAEGTGDAERGAFHSFITGRTVSVFDFLTEHGGAVDFRAARARIAEVSGVPLPPPTSAPRSAPAGRGDRPEIRVNNRQLRDIVADGWRAVRVANRRPALFVRSGALVRLARVDDGPRIDAMDEASVYGYMARIADWVKVTEDAVIDVSPVKDVARDMLVYPHAELPALEAVVSTPVFDRSGELVSSPGYHAGARLWYHHQDGFDVPSVADRPTPGDIAAARTLLVEDLLVDFPFAAASDRAHALGALMLPFVRRMVAGCTPIHLVEAPTPGSGKGLLGDLVSIVTVGRTCEPTTLTSDEDEARKKITSILAKAQPVILIDNIKDGLESAQLACALTAETWSDRILGQSRMIDLPNRATWIVTANNPRLSLEIARRCVRIRLDAKTDRPWTRTGFKHTPLRDWAKANRAKLVHAVLVLVRAWISSGRRPGPRTLGSFESWASVVGGVLEHADIPGFLHDTEALYEAADADGQEWREFVGAWWEKFGQGWVGASALLELALERDLLGSAVGEKSPRSQKTRLGKALARMRDRHFASWRVVAGRDSNSKTAQYRLVQIDDGGSSVPPGGQLELDGGPAAEDCGRLRYVETNLPQDLPQGNDSDDTGL